MAKFDIKGPTSGSTVRFALRRSGSTASLVEVSRTDWAVPDGSGGGDGGLPSVLALEAEAGVVSRIPLSTLGQISGVEIASQPGLGHVSLSGTDILINLVDEETAIGEVVAAPTGTPFGFDLLVSESGKAPVTMAVTVTPIRHKTLCGWSCGRGIKLAVDSNDATVLEPGETHADIYVSLSASAYDKTAVIAEVGSWLMANRVDDYIAAQITPGGGDILGHAVSHNPTTYFGSRAKPLMPDDAKDIVAQLASTHGFETVHIHYERGYDYSGNKGAAVVGGAGLLHPHAVLAWGEGSRPILGGAKFNGSIKMHGLVMRGLEFPMGDGVESAAGSNVIIEDCAIPGLVYFYGNDGTYPARFTVRNSILPQAFDTSGLDPANPSFWKGNYRPSCIKPGGGSNGIMIQGNFVAWGGAGPEYLNTFGPDGVPSKDDAYGYEQIGSDPRWGLNGFATPGPNLLTHPIYFDSFTRHILMRDNFVFGSGGSLIQLRGGAVMRNCAFTWGNQMFAFGKGLFDNYGDTVHPDYADGHRSLGQDVVVTHAGYLDGPNAGNALSEGVKVAAPLVAFDRFLVLHDLNPNDPADQGRLVSDWNGDIHARKDGLIYHDEEFGPGGIFEHYRGRERQTLAYWGTQTHNPDSLDLSNVSDATIFRWYDAQRGNAPDTTTDILDVYWWLREHEGPEITALVRSFIAFMQAPMGIAPTWRTSAAACSFVPDLAEDGCRWDNPNNWGGDLIPGSFAGDTVTLNGHKVFFQDHTLTVAGLDLGAGGHLQAVNGRLNVSAAPVCTGGGALTTDESGQVWVKGYQGAAPLAVTVKGGRFANTGTFSGPADIHVDGSTDPHGKAEFLCAHGAAAMTVRSGRKMEIVGSGPRVGFDGTGGAQARLSFESGAVLSFVAENGRLATIREFRSGVNGTAAPDVVSTVALGGATLALDLTGVAAGSHVLVAADSVTGSFGSVSGKIDPGLDATVSVLANGVGLTVTAGSGRIVLG
ncbi:hypothetical protein DSD19_10590 [Rhodovulum sp. BSW8]|uniref:hypothetical protein n=1 Tax=Rhodovulum sp. BSW8 TaxID=2259645 RepID=UPI000DF9B14C|nr:hypothetical protein [Rhodovulum sp. BSW8]RBO53189.1 hypothetical protein DSD19_10590 [Rhodovulum sp. BSW8]